MHYLIAYDICCPKRLRRVARLLEKQALRAQKSVFLFRGSRAQLNQILHQVGRIIDPREDLVQAWRLARNQRPDGTRRGPREALFPVAAVVQAGRVRIVEDI